MGQTWTLPFAEGATASGFSLDDLTVALLIGSAVLVVAVAAVRLSLRSGLPSLLIYLGIGLVLGESGFGIHYDNQQQTQVLGYAALVLILVEGGLTTRWSGIRRSVAPAAVLATVGVGVSVLVVGVAAHVFLGWDWQIAFLVAAVLASTDAAAVFSVLRRVPLPRQISGVLEAESGFNDAPVVLLVTAIAAGMTPGATPDPWWQVGLIAVLELVGGAVIGLAIGWGGARLLRLVASTSSALFAIGVISVAVLAYAVADVGAHLGLPRLLPGGARARQPEAPAPAGRAGVRDRDRLAGPDRPVRAARAARPPGRLRGRALAGPRRGGGPVAARPPAVGPRVAACRSGCRGAPRPSCRGPGCAVRCRSCWRPCPAPWAPPA